jgi:hypothetical protein
MKAPAVLHLISSVAIAFAAFSFAAGQTAEERQKLLDMRREIEAKSAAKGAPSLSRLSPKELFVSPDGSFSIRLPKTADGQHAISQNDGMTTGNLYVWVTEEAGVVVSSADFSDPKFRADESDDELVNYFAGMRNAVLRERSATLLTQKAVVFAGHKGYEFSFRFPNGAKGIARGFLAGRRGYTMIAHLDEGAAAERLTWRAFDSFELLSGKPADTPAKRKQ